ncbi:hypothetical protein CAPTEDRAFT_149044 [Capitella teleta]|uniref:J domain-containing protein n=1 Tax=Capitella teleta TaxID=283909 RepID=R7VHS1_CAPTE|nr:hypothetical protein CAPTEDRAFT_149044 [Capitella teleta]|eukprot:ELU15225.1 hypothetical protein CAPTEDRAFT_149044 [Capitella teleta]
MDSILSFDPKKETFYDILGCDELSSTEQILTEYKKRALCCHPDKSDRPEAAKKFALLQQAKEILTDDKGRAQYDKWMRSGLTIPYSEWHARKDTIHTSLHWASKSKKTPALEGQCEDISQDDQDDFPQTSWSRDASSDALWNFRNYKI